MLGALFLIFRRDINGLRAIALVGVLLFHFKPNWLAGGFAGVDVFFVISGFLMTKIIFTDLPQETRDKFRFVTFTINDKSEVTGSWIAGSQVSVHAFCKLSHY